LVLNNGTKNYAPYSSTLAKTIQRQNISNGPMVLRLKNAIVVRQDIKAAILICFSINIGKNSLTF
jgi:hypothetical protein